eukprot:gene14548-19530_t
MSSRTSATTKKEHAYLFRYLLLANFFQYLEAGAVPALLLQLSEAFGMNSGQQGLLGGVVYLSISLGGPVAGYLLRHFDHKRVLSITITLNLILTLIWALTPVNQTYSNSMFIAVRFCMGFTQCVVCVFLPLWTNENAPRLNRTTWMSYLQASVPFGVMTGYIIASVVILFVNKSGVCFSLQCWRWPFLIEVMLLTPICIGVYFIPKEHISIRVHKRPNKSKYVNNSAYNPINKSRFMAEKEERLKSLSISPAKRNKPNNLIEMMTFNEKHNLNNDNAADSAYSSFNNTNNPLGSVSNPISSYVTHRPINDSEEDELMITKNIIHQLMSDQLDVEEKKKRVSLRRSSMTASMFDAMSTRNVMKRSVDNLTYLDLDEDASGYLWRSDRSYDSTNSFDLDLMSIDQSIAAQKNPPMITSESQTPLVSAMNSLETIEAPPSIDEVVPIIEDVKIEEINPPNSSMLITHKETDASVESNSPNRIQFERRTSDNSVMSSTFSDYFDQNGNLYYDPDIPDTAGTFSSEQELSVKAGKNNEYSQLNGNNGNDYCSMKMSGSSSSESMTDNSTNNNNNNNNQPQIITKSQQSAIYNNNNNNKRSKFVNYAPPVTDIKYESLKEIAKQTSMHSHPKKRRSSSSNSSPKIMQVNQSSPMPITNTIQNNINNNYDVNVANNGIAVNNGRSQSYLRLHHLNITNDGVKTSPYEDNNNENKNLVSNQTIITDEKDIKEEIMYYLETEDDTANNIDRNNYYDDQKRNELIKDIEARTGISPQHLRVEIFESHSQSNSDTEEEEWAHLTPTKLNYNNNDADNKGTPTGEENKKSIFYFFKNIFRSVRALLSIGVYRNILGAMTALYFTVTGVQYWGTKYLSVALNAPLPLVNSLFILCAASGPTL